MRWTVLLLACLMLSACMATVNSCPPPKVYSQEFQNRLADELQALPDGSALAQAMTDYGSERAQLRACRGE
jgi:outer membrane biogenesis lipoprotein LolB